MACDLTSGYLLSNCIENTPGIIEYYIAVGVTASLQTMTYSAGNITGLSGFSFYTFQPAPLSSDWIDEGSTTIESYSKSRKHTANIFIPGNNATISQTIDVLTKNKLYVMAKDNDGVYWFLGRTNGLYVQTSTYNSGKKGGDARGWNLVISNESSEPAAVVSSAVAIGAIVA